MSFVKFNQLTARLIESGHFESLSSDSDSDLYRDWSECAGDDLAQHTRRVLIRKNILEIVVDKPNWASRVFHMQTRLLVQMQALGHSKLTEISVRVKPPKKFKSPQHIATETETIPTSNDTGNLLQQLADQSSNPRTRATLLRLSKHHRGE